MALHYEIGQKVTLTHYEGVVFEVTAQNYDGSYNVQMALGSDQVLSYQFVSQEMIRKIQTELT